MLTSLLLIYSGDAVAGKILYDDFSSAYINGSKWRQRTIVREIVDGQYVSKLGNRTPGMGAEFAPGLFLNSMDFSRNFVNLDSINSIKCDITIIDSKLDSALDSQSYARIGGLFYSTNPTGGGTGDIWAEVGIGDRGNGGLEVFGIVAEFLADNYLSWRIIDTVTVIGPIKNVTYPITFTLKLGYNGSNGFEFWADDNNKSMTGPEYQEFSYGKTKTLETVIKATNSSNNGYISAKFDNVYINNQTTVYDDFSSDLIDPAKWEKNEKVRESPSGYLRANITGDGSTRAVSTHLTEKNAPYLEAKMRIDSGSQLSPGAWGIGRIQGYFYNDSRGPGSGQNHNKYEGDVFVQVRLRYNSDGTLSANAYVDRTNDENESSYTNLFSHDFSGPIVLDTDYILSIRFKGKKLIFSCAGETAEYEITTPIYTAYGEHRLLRSRVHLDPGETGYMKVWFDDVYIEKKGKFMPSAPLLLLDD